MDVSKINLKNLALCRKKGERSYHFYSEIFYNDSKIGKLIGEKKLKKDKDSRIKNSYSIWNVGLRYTFSPVWRKEIHESIDKFKKAVKFRYPVDIKNNEFPEEVGIFLIKMIDNAIVGDIIRKTKKRRFKYLVRVFKVLNQASKDFELEFYEINDPDMELAWILKKHPDSKILIYESDNESGISLYGDCDNDCFCPKCIKRCSGLN